MPQISVIIPVYKVESYLHRCVDSILSQTYTDFELILVDDGSPDNCGIICDEYAAKDNRVVVIHQKNGGLSAARNAGIDWAFANSDSEWITFIDSDDWINRDFLRTLYESCINNHVDISMCYYEKTTGISEVIQNENIRSSNTTPEWIWRNHRVMSTIACCKLYRKILFHNIRFSVGVIHEDEYTTYRVLFKCENIAVIENKMYYYYTNPASVMNQEWSEANLHQVYAFREQIIFFRKKGFMKAYSHSVALYLNRILESLEKLKKLPNYDERLFKKLEHDYRIGIWKYGISGGYEPTSETGRLYHFFFLFVKMQRFLNKKWVHLKSLLQH